MVGAERCVRVPGTGRGTETEIPSEVLRSRPQPPDPFPNLVSVSAVYRTNSKGILFPSRLFVVLKSVRLFPSRHQVRAQFFPCCNSLYIVEDFPIPFTIWPKMVNIVSGTQKRAPSTAALGRRSYMSS